MKKSKRLIDNSKKYTSIDELKKDYNIGFDSEWTKPVSNKVSNYDRYIKKLEDGKIDKFNSRDFLFFFSDKANENGVKHVIANAKISMANFKTILSRGYTNAEILVMIEFLFTSGQQYLDIHTLHPGILLTNWCNTIYRDSQLWLKDEYNPNAKYKSKPKTEREWKDDKPEHKTGVGEW